jgi:hypothetical protein
MNAANGLDWLAAGQWMLAGGALMWLNHLALKLKGAGVFE